jgi:hypothetical protein
VKRWLKRLGVTLLILAVGAGVRYAYVRHQAITALQAAVDELDREDPGWRLQDIEAARVWVPDHKNSALCTVAVNRLLPKEWPSREFDEAFADLEPQRRLRPEDYRRLCKELDAVQPACAEAHRLADLPTGRHHIVYRRLMVETLLKDQQQVRRVTRLLACEAMWRDEEGDAKGALLCGRAALNAGRSLGDEPTGISQLIRVACVIQACRAVERTLAQGEPPVAEMIDLQKLFEEEEAHPTMLIMMRGERAALHETFDALESGEVDLRWLEEVGGPAKRSWTNRLFDWRIRDQLRAEHPLMLKFMSKVVAISRLPAHEQLEAERELEAEVRGLPKHTFLTRSSWLVVLKLSDVFWRKLAYVRCLIVALAAERYRRKHGVWPETLDRLAPDFIHAVPLDPYDGEPLRYRRLDDGVVIYSVGADGRDGGGTIDRQEPTRTGADLGIRLWDVKHRRQAPPLPRPDADVPELLPPPLGPPD